MDYHEISKLTVTKLREMAMEYEDIKGASGMTKEQLLPLLCEKMDIEYKEHDEVKSGVDKTALKRVVKDLKTKHAEAVQAGDRTQAKVLRRRLHHAKRRLRRSIVHIAPE